MSLSGRDGDDPRRPRSDSLLLIPGDADSRLSVPGTDWVLPAPAAARTWSGWVACAVLVAGFSLAGGLWGVLAGAGTVVAWLGLGTPYALATGVVLSVGLTPQGIGLLPGLSVGAGLVALLLAPVVRASEPRAYAVTALSTTALLGAIAVFLAGSQPVWVVAAVLAGVCVLVIYGLSRFQQLRLGTLEDGDPTINAGDDV